MSVVRTPILIVLAMLIFSAPVTAQQAETVPAGDEVPPAPSAADDSTPAASPSADVEATPLPELEVVGKKAVKKKPVRSVQKTSSPASGAQAVNATDVVTPPAAIGPFSEQERAAYSSPVSSTYVSGENLQRFSGTSPSDVLRGIPGVTIGETRNGGGIDANIRGLQGQRRISVTVDGAENTIDTYRGYAGSQQRSYLDPDLLSDMTVTKGPTSALGAIGGTVAATTLKPSDILRPGQSVGVRVKGNIASNSTTEPSAFRVSPETETNGLFDSDAANGSIAAAMREQYFDIVVAAAARDQGNYFAGRKLRLIDEFGDQLPNSILLFQPGEEVLNTSVETQSLLLKTTIRPLEGHALELSYRSFDSEMGEIMPSQIIRNSTGFIPQWRPGLYQTDTYTARYTYKPKDNPLVDFRVGGFFTKLYSDAFNNPANNTPAPYAAIRDESDEFGHIALYGAKMNQRRFGFDLANTMRLDTDAGKLTFDYGTSFGLEDVGPSSRGYQATIENLANNQYFRSAVRGEINAFGTMTWQPVKALTIAAGGRYTEYAMRDRNRRAIAQIHAARPRRVISFFFRNAAGATFRSGAYWYSDPAGNFQSSSDPIANPNTILTAPYFGTLNQQIANFRRAGYELVPLPADPWAGASVTLVDRVVGGVFAPAIEQDDSGYAPNASVSLEVLEGMRLYTSYAGGVRMPGIFETTLGYAVANPGGPLRPERAKNWEAGASSVQQGVLTPRDELMMKVAYFDNRVDDFISRFSRPSTQTTRFSFDWENNDNFRVRGFELQAAYDAGFIFADASATYNFEATTCNAERAAFLRSMDFDGFRPFQGVPNCIAGGFLGEFTTMQNPPELSLSVTLGVRLFDERLTLGGRLIHYNEPIATLNKPWNDTYNARQAFVYENLTVVDLFSSLKLSDASELTFGVDNVANLYYMDPLAVSFMPSPGRTFKTGFSAKF